jgi:5-histidylcysteine sulfoxide synthase
VLIRQLPVELLSRPVDWEYLPGNGYTHQNELISVAGGSVHLGKSQDSSTYGWDIDYGDRTVVVDPFQVSQYLISNAEFLEFVKAGGYENPTYWTATAWQWKIQYDICHPKFWIADRQSPGCYQYRAMFDVLAMPFNYPVEVNYYEAIAYCRWYNERTGQTTRLMTEAEWHRVAYGLQPHSQPVQDYNLDCQWGSPHAVGAIPTAQNAIGIYDLRGNVWEWLSDHLTPLPGYAPHDLYEDYSASYFDTQHQMMAGGSWISCGIEAFPHYRNWFRPNFYQHAGFRLAQVL